MNVSIPALFTSYTTAHLLSSLIPSGGHLAPSIPAVIMPGNGKTPGLGDRYETASIESSSDSEDSDNDDKSTGWFRTILSCFGLGSGNSGSSTRQPGSDEDNWVVAQDWDEDLPKTSKHKGSSDKKTTGSETTDNFVIGVHDWRNPDLVKKPSTPQHSSEEEEKTAKRSKPKARELSGGPATPESGRYDKPDKFRSTKPAIKKEPTKNEKSEQSSTDSHKTGWLSGLKDSKPQVNKDNKPKQKLPSTKLKPTIPKSEPITQETPHHEGLWVTLSPTTMSSSPFVDTLLVLVVSPLVTLTLVYALLLIRSRIRRRRWRAPKSVVDRLPVRTYHTIPSGASTSSIATPMPGTPGPNTPLLASTVIARTGGRSPRSLSRHRPRSFTTSEVLDQVGPSTVLPPGDDAASMTESEKREQGLAEWRKRYGGRQRECVVCLEEYVDGISRVMSLPCGHEFHVDCM
jgi:hypothetical protein